jgi:hypothetical protein
VTGQEFDVTCDRSLHRLRLEGDRLTALAHPSPPAAERALAALAGIRYRCVETLDKWERGDESPHTLPVALREPARARAIASLDEGGHPARDASILEALALEGLQELAASGAALVPAVDERRTIIGVTLIGSAGPAHVEGFADGRIVSITARLPLRWWTVVWRHGHSRESGEFVTDYDRSCASSRRVRTVRWANASRGFSARLCAQELILGPRSESSRS